MLNKRDFTDVIKRDLVNFLPANMAESVVVGDMEVVKINDQKLHGITIRENGENAAMTFYIDDAFDKYKSGEDITVIMADLAASYEHNLDMPKPPAIDLKWDELKDDLSVRVVDKQRNREFLRDRPYVDTGNGLAVICDINMGGYNGEWRIGVNKDVLATLGVEPDTLFSVAMDRSVINEPPILTDMSQALFDRDAGNLLDGNNMIAPEDLSGMYVLTNSSASFGAATLFYPDVREKAAEILGTGYYVLPSSQHEVIIVPDTAGISEKDLSDMVKQANRTVVEPHDILSDNVYHYDRDSRELSRVMPERDKSDREAR